jgi:hypothetical protein
MGNRECIFAVTSVRLPGTNQNSWPVCSSWGWSKPCSKVDPSGISTPSSGDFTGSFGTGGCAVPVRVAGFPHWSGGRWVVTSG